jgi:hypothetical protein
VARCLRRLADRISHDTGPRRLAAYFTIEPGRGSVIHETEYIQIRPPAPGCPLYFMEEDYHRAFVTAPAEPDPNEVPLGGQSAAELIEAAPLAADVLRQSGISMAGCGPRIADQPVCAEA